MDAQGEFSLALTAFTGVNTLGIVLLAYRAGNYVKQIDVNTQRIAAIEVNGSPAVGRLEEKLDGFRDRLGEFGRSLERIERLLVAHVTHENGSSAAD